MYNRFFGFKERPFKLVPNPEYLFLSKIHEEALAHLNYAVNDGDGFVEITGEVGTGKTTLCRMFLENLDEDTEAAFIFNPKLDPDQLLQTINDEFGITGAKGTTKDHIDLLNRFLIEKKSQDKKAILLIDEAQNLNADVLEQLRLLSNLETTTSKLLQIFLVGQPELGELLDSHELRQLNQRITMSCHLMPLSFSETKEYIKHRIGIASHGSGVQFTPSAYRAIFNYSGGVPRLINIACDRALLTAFAVNQKKITGKTAKNAIKELAPKKNKPPGRGPLILAITAVCAVVFIGTVLLVPLLVKKDVSLKIADTVFYKVTGADRGDKTVEKAPPEPPVTEPITPVGDTENKTQTADDAVSPDKGENAVVPDVEAEKTAETENQTLAVEKAVEPEIQSIAVEKAVEPEIQSIFFSTPAELKAFLLSAGYDTLRHDAIQNVLMMWEQAPSTLHLLDRLEDDREYFSIAARQSGLISQYVEADLTILNRLNLPAVLKFNLKDAKHPRYLPLVRIEDKTMVFSANGNHVKAAPATVARLWMGTTYVIWKDFFNYKDAISESASTESIMTLKLHLKEIGFDGLEMTPVFDDMTRQVIKDVQKKNGLDVDGVVGPFTKIVLYNANSSLSIPHILN